MRGDINQHKFVRVDFTALNIEVGYFNDPIYGLVDIDPIDYFSINN